MSMTRMPPFVAALAGFGRNGKTIPSASITSDHWQNHLKNVCAISETINFGIRNVVVSDMIAPPANVRPGNSFAKSSNFLSRTADCPSRKIRQKVAIANSQQAKISTIYILHSYIMVHSSRTLSSKQPPASSWSPGIIQSAPPRLRLFVGNRSIPSYPFRVSRRSAAKIPRLEWPARLERFQALVLDRPAAARLNSTEEAVATLGAAAREPCSAVVGAVFSCRRGRWRAAESWRESPSNLMRRIADQPAICATQHELHSRTTKEHFGMRLVGLTTMGRNRGRPKSYGGNR